jgi:drug/metabolite transporter (DMT)-like permease
MDKGILVALIATLLISGADLFKKRLIASCDSMVVICFQLPLAILVGLTFLHFKGSLSLDLATAWKPALIIASVFLGSELCFLRSFKLAEMSLVFPLNSLLPVFGIILGMMFLGEDPNFIALSGIALTVVGSYLLFREPGQSSGIFRPFLAIFENRGARYMCFCKLLGAFVMVAFKLWDPTNSPVMFFCLVMFFEWLLVCLVVLVRMRTEGRAALFANTVSRLWILIGAGIFWGAGFAAIFLANSLTLVVYVSAILQLEMLIVVPLAAVFFKEKELRQRLSACLVMLAGVLVIVLFGRA